MGFRFVLCCLVLSFLKLSGSVELTFELPDSARECFHQEIKKNTSATIEYQVFYYFYSLPRKYIF